MRHVIEPLAGEVAALTSLLFIYHLPLRMGWPWQRDSDKGQSVQAQSVPAGSSQLRASAEDRTAVAVSTFEFGKQVQPGDEYLKGSCAGDNPDAIQACVWSIQTSGSSGRGKQPLYHIEF